MTTTPTISYRLEDVRDDLLSFLRRHAGWVLKLEQPEDLLQGLHVRALERGKDARFETRGQFLKWIYTVARSYIADRKAHWSALKRDSSRLVRLTTAGGDAGAAAITGPATSASRRELNEIAIRALAVLRPRDRRLVRWTAEGVSLEEQAERLEITYTAVRAARQRAIERFRKAFELARRKGG